MAKKKFEDFEIVDEPEQEAQPAPKVAEVKPYSMTLWAGVKEVWKCMECGEFRDSVDDIILHIITHVSIEKQEALLEKLLGEK